jgi:hypothetical protein
MNAKFLQCFLFIQSTFLASVFSREAKDVSILLILTVLVEFSLSENPNQLD